MPCDSIETTTVDLSKANIDLVHAALKSMDLNPTLSPNGRIYFRGGEFNPKDGQLTLREYRGEGRSEAITNELRQAYAAETVKKNASKFGWSLKQVGKYKYEATKKGI